VQKKRAQLSSLRGQLRSAEAQLSSLEAQEQQSLAALSICSYGTSQYEKLDNEVSSRRSQRIAASCNCSDLKQKIKGARKPPAHVLHALPSSKTAALAWICHFHSPSHYRLLSRASFLSQQLLLPAFENIDTAFDISCPSFCSDLLAHYNSQQQRHPGSVGCLELLSPGKVPASVGPTSVDDISER